MAFQSGVYGSVIDRATGLGFANVLVLWTVTDASVSTKLGSARTAADGSFSIGLLDTAEAGDAACRLQHHPEWTAQVAAATDDGRPIAAPPRYSPDVRRWIDRLISNSQHDSYTDYNERWHRHTGGARAAI